MGIISLRCRVSAASGGASPAAGGGELALPAAAVLFCFLLSLYHLFTGRATRIGPIAGVLGKVFNLAFNRQECPLNCSPSRGQRKNIKFSRPAAKCCWPLFMQQGTTCVFLSASARPSYAGLFWCCNNGCSTQSFARVPVCW